MSQYFWPPAGTGQYTICPIPFHLDTYRGCVYQCAYCFARDITAFARRNTRKGTTFIDGNDPPSFKRWMARTYGQVKDYSKPETVFLNNRMPLKVGATSDPCPPHERQTRITERFLAILGRYDYPTEVQTKNPGILLESLRRLGKGLNLTIAVTVISTDTDWTTGVEPYAPSPHDRLKAIEAIVTELGYPVMVKCQPATYPRIMTDLPPLIRSAANAGVWAFNTEGLKCRIALCKAEQEVFKAMGPTVRDDYRTRIGQREGGDYVLQDSYKLEYIQLARELAKEYGLAYYSADNSPLGYGDGPECCGTARLRDYRLFNYNLRSKAFGVFEKDDIGLAQVPSGRATSCKGMTLIEAVDKHIAANGH